LLPEPGPYPSAADRAPRADARASQAIFAAFHISEYIEASANDMLPVVREQGLEGIVAKRRDSLYKPGKRACAWIKYGVNRGQEFVIGGYLLGPHGLDSLIVGYYRGEDLIYVARVRNGLVPASRRDVFEKLRGLVSRTCPFVNLPDKHRSRWGERAHRGQDEKVRMAASRARGTGRVSGVDLRGSS
jgi:ATP-dependent DNA ligase